jgi:phosphatidylserine synthase
MNNILQKTKDLDFDNNFALFIINFFPSFFSLLNPNLITLIGIILNNYFINYVFQGKNNMAYIAITLRILADIFDGNIARRFNKKSNVGGFLDTLADLILSFTYMYIISFSLTKSNNKSLVFSFICIFMLINFLIKEESITSHNNIKNVKKTNNIFNFGFEFSKLMITVNLLLTLPLQFFIIKNVIKNL